MARRKVNQPDNYSPCFICSSSIIKSNIKLDHDDDDQSFVLFLLTTLLEIPQNQVVTHLQEKLLNQQLNTIHCESCKNVISSAKQVYKQILLLSQKFRKIQKQVVEQISNSDDTSHSNYPEILEFCRNFLIKHNFNNFGFPFLVDDLPQPQLPPVKQEPPSSDEDVDGDANDSDYQPLEVDCQLDEDNIQNSPCIASHDEDNLNSDNDSNFEPEPPISKKSPSKKIPPIKNVNKSPSSSKKKRNRKSLSSSDPDPRPPKKLKPTPPLKQSRFEQRYPNYPPRLRDPTTNKFHCLESPCLKMYPRKTDLERHIIIEHLQDNFYKCEEPSCGKSYAQREHFEDHVSWHKGIPRWKCQEKVTTTATSGGEPCTEQFFCRKKLNRHVQQVHQQDKQFICEICGSNFSCQDYLTVHKYSKHKPEDGAGSASVSTSSDLICNYCGKTFNVKATLNVHINLVHEKTLGGFPCQFCEYKFIAKNLLKMHLWRVHKFKEEGYQPSKSKNKVEEQAYRCEVTGCKKGFQKEGSLRKHMEERHGGGGGQEECYKFNCKYCGKGFHLKRVLDNHQKVHENKESKPFNCEICGKGFAIMRYVYMHKRNAHKMGIGSAIKN